MNCFARLSTHALVLGQLAIGVGALALLAFYPPRQGAMILLPLMPGAGDAAIVRATQVEARLVGTGPFPQSFIVWGERARIAPAMLAHGVLVLSAPTLLCGTIEGVAA